MKRGDGEGQRRVGDLRPLDQMAFNGFLVSLDKITFNNGRFVSADDLIANRPTRADTADLDISPCPDAIWAYDDNDVSPSVNIRNIFEWPLLRRWRPQDTQEFDAQFRDTQQSED
ncbi:MAG: hypothetical protein GTN69_12260 [Armatimonadetes bacterium]|nr:hypothetical protein [Armatimonadota bacterium]NIO76624.1 hypothetical protein [Armatimonadota bacterium]NIO96433.1 hypothetical protein [Armatimonadota bacterium]